MKDGRRSITVADILGKCRRENVAMARNIAVGLLMAVGFTVSTCSMMMNRSPPAVRNMLRADRQLQQTCAVYRMAQRQARGQCREERAERETAKAREERNKKET